MTAIISDCGQYRYRLDRGAGQAPTATAIVMVNPSTADADHDDATIRRLRGFAARHGWGWIVVGNLFAWRATDVRDLARVADPVGPLTDRYLDLMFRQAERVVFAWGPVAKLPRAHADRWRAVAALAASLGHTPLMIGAPTRRGHPRHPLMLPYAAPVTPWIAPS